MKRYYVIDDEDGLWVDSKQLKGAKKVQAHSIGDVVVEMVCRRIDREKQSQNEKMNRLAS